jgi:endonuclease/exonuclease/phosphatase family metal-dependent hydrolase
MIVGVEADGATPIFGDLRLSDRDVILVKDSNRISYSTTIANNFTVNGITSVGGTNIEFTRGYTMADINVRGADYRFVNTHLETGGSEPYNTLQAVQMNELLQVIEATTPESTPVILLGDFNSSPDDVPFTSTSGIPGLDGLPLVPPYLQAVGSGYLDLWLSKPKARDGFTCCFDGAVSDEDAALYQRIDHIFFNPKDREINKLKIKLVGQSNADMTDDSGLYPSDHAGLFGKIKLEK